MDRARLDFASPNQLWPQKTTSSLHREEIFTELSLCTNMALGRATEVFLGQGVIKDQVHNPIPVTALTIVDLLSLPLLWRGLSVPTVPPSPHPFPATQVLWGRGPCQGDAVGSLLMRWAPLADSPREAAWHCPPSHRGASSSVATHQQGPSSWMAAPRPLPPLASH